MGPGFFITGWEITLSLRVQRLYIDPFAFSLEDSTHFHSYSGPILLVRAFHAFLLVRSCCHILYFLLTPFGLLNDFTVCTMMFKCIVPCIHNQANIYSSFTTLKKSCGASYIQPSLPSSLGNYCQAFAFPDCHMFTIITCISFVDWILALRNMHFKILCLSVA